MMNATKTLEQRNKKIIVAIIGLVGSGKSTIARALSAEINAKVLSADEVRLELRKKGQNYEKINEIIEDKTKAIIKSGKNVIIDSDFVDGNKRRRLEAKAKRIGTTIIYLRTFSDIDVMIGRLINARYSPQSFFGGAGTNWQGPNKGAVVALREMFRRNLHHYTWSKNGGGQFVLKKLKIPFIAEIDTTLNWQSKVKEVARRIKAL